jgi:hypothetical protein
VSDPITPTDISRLASNESIISAVLKWAAANGRRLSKADLERMGAGVDAIVEENARLTKERDDARERIKRLEEAGDEIIWAFCPASVSMMTERESDALKLWNQAKEAKP